MNLMEETEGRVRLTSRGRFLAETVFTELSLSSNHEGFGRGAAK